MKDKIARVKELAKKYSYELTFVGGMAVGVGAVLVSLKSPGELYNPAQPIPTIGLSEDAIIRDLLSGVMVAEFIKKRKLTKDLTQFGFEWWETINAAAPDPNAIREALGELSDGDFSLLSRLKLER